MSYKLCKICGEKRATKRHVEGTHGIDYEEYLARYEKEKHIEKQVIKKINELYITVRHKWAEMNRAGEYAVYSTIEGLGRNRKFGLVDRDIKEHLEQRKTLAVFTPREYSKFMVFDIDRADIGLLEEIYNALLVYLPAEAIHCSWSGNKGYHITIFFKRLIPKTVLQKFFAVVMNDVGKPENVELLAGDNKAIKLPLGINFKNRDNSSNYCYFCNQFGLEVKDSMEYLLDIKAIEPDVIYEIVEVNYDEYISINGTSFTEDEIIEIEELLELKNKAHFENYTIANKISSIEKAIELGLNEPNSRHKTMLNIAVYLKDIKGFSIEETRKFLSDWIAKQDKSFYKSTEKEIEQDIKYMTSTVYRKDYKLKVKKREVGLNVLDLREILSVKSKALRRLYFILYIHGKAYADNTGTFYMTYEQIQKAGNKSDEKHLKNQIKKLQELGKVNIIRESEYKKPNKYQIPALTKVMDIEIKEFFICDMNCKDCLEKACAYLLKPEEIKQYWYKDSKRILSLTGSCENPKNNNLY